MISSLSSSEIQVEYFRYDIVSGIKRKCKGKHKSVSEVFEGASTDAFIVGRIINENYGCTPLKLRKFILSEVHPNGDTGEKFAVFFFEKKYHLQAEVDDYLVIHNPWIFKTTFINHLKYLNIQYTFEIIVGKERKINHGQEKDNRQYLQILRTQAEGNEETEVEEEVTSCSALSKALEQEDVQIDEIGQSSLANKDTGKTLCTPSPKKTCDDLSHRTVESTNNSGKVLENQQCQQQRDHLVNDYEMPSTSGKLSFSSKKTNTEQSHDIKENRENEEAMSDSSETSLKMSDLQQLSQDDDLMVNDTTSIDTDIDEEWVFNLEMSESPRRNSPEVGTDEGI